MADQTKIEWADKTFNPWIGCEKLSPACKYCYAEELMDKRYKRAKWGKFGTRIKTSESNWKKPLLWNKQALKDGIRYRVFCSSLADVFEDRKELVPWRKELLELIKQTPNLIWMLLTKRPENIIDMIPKHWTERPNVWIGATMENQLEYDKKINHLIQAKEYIQCPVSFISAEPLLEGISTTELVDWVIIGGESGNNARILHLPSALRLASSTNSAKSALFVKQLGTKLSAILNLSNKKGGDISEWPESVDSLKYRETPIHNRFFGKNGEKAALAYLEEMNNLHLSIPYGITPEKYANYFYCTQTIFLMY